MTKAYNKFFINGEWVEPSGRSTLDVINPATEEAFATISMGTADDVDAAAKAVLSKGADWDDASRSKLAAMFPGLPLVQVVAY